MTGVQDGATSPTRIAQRLLGRAAERELVPADPRSSVRWHQHGYPGPFCRWNYHPELEIHLIRHGTGRFIVGDKIGTFGPGHLVLVGPNLPHDWISDLEPGQVHPDRDVVLQFDRDWLHRSQHVLPELDALNGLIADAGRGIEFLGATAREAADHLEKVGTTDGPRRVAHLFNLFAALLSAPLQDRRTLADQFFHPQGDHRITEVMDLTLRYILGNLDTEIRMGPLAQQAGMSDSAFSKYMVRASNMTFTDMVRQLRLSQACRLLQQSNATVASISHSVGYTNLSNFNRQFRREYGLTPREFRTGANV